MKTIAVLNAKGGVGKTAVSHLISWILGEADYAVFLLHTDARSENHPKKVQNRPYITWSLRPHLDPDRALVEYEKLRETISDIDNCVMIIDGGANRRNVDTLVSEGADLIIIPVGVSDGDVTEALETYQRVLKHRQEKKLPSIPIRFLLSNWPGERRKLNVILRGAHIARFYHQTQNVRMETIVTNMPSIVLIMDPTEPSMNMTLRRAGREVADEVCELLGLPSLSDMAKRAAMEAAAEVDDEILQPAEQQGLVDAGRGA